MPAPRVFPSQDIIEKMSPEDRKAMGLKTRGEIESKLESKVEAQIQSEVEAYLRQNGFWPRSPAYLDGRTPPNGWYVHLNETRKNPILLDLLIMTHSGRCIEIELKTATGKLREHQQVILDTTKCAHLARSTGEAVGLIQRWMKEVL